MITVPGKDDAIIRSRKNSLRANYVIDIRDKAETVFWIGNLVKRKITIVITAKPGSRRAWFQMIVGSAAHLKAVVPTRLAGIDCIDCAAISAGIEVAACAGLDIIASCLHVPEQRLAQLYGCCFIRKDTFHAEHRGDWHGGERSKWSQWNDHPLLR